MRCILEWPHLDQEISLDGYPVLNKPCLLQRGSEELDDEDGIRAVLKFVRKLKRLADIYIYIYIYILFRKYQTIIYTQEVEAYKATKDSICQMRNNEMVAGKRGFPSPFLLTWHNSSYKDE